jgi:hypothetical protein
MSRSDETLPDLPFRAPPEPCAKVSASIRKQCTQGLSKKRGLPAFVRFGLSLGLSAAVFGLLWYLGQAYSRPEGAVRGALFGAAGWAIVQAVVLFVGLVRPPGMRISRSLRLLLAVALPIAFMAYLAYAAQQRLPLGEFMTHGDPGWAVACGLHALLFSAIAAAGTLFLWRGTDPLTPGLSGALAGLVGGLGGAAAIGVACPSGETWHLWIGHGVTVVLIVLASFVVGRRWLAP